MMISKYKDAKGNTNVYIVINRNWLKDTKRPEYVRLTLNANWDIGLDNKEKCKLGDLINLDKLKDNTAPKK